jgi:RNA polymerase sigma-70 factor (ECF subfamily)
VDFEAIYREHRDDVARFVRVRLGRGGDVADVCQEIWAAAARGLPLLPGGGSFRAWLFAIARNKTADVWRRRDPFETLESELGEGGALAEVFGVHPPTTPSRALARRRRVTALRSALARMRPEDRELIELRFVHGLKPGEIAGMLEERAPANTIAQRIRRAILSLRLELVQCGVAH